MHKWPACGVRAALIVAIACAGCGKTARQTPLEGPARTDAARAPGSFPTLSVDTALYPQLGPAVRHIGETAGGGVVLAAGMEEWRVAQAAISRAEYASGLRRLVAGLSCQVQVTPNYAFLYPNGYDALAALSIQESIDARYRDMTASYAIGAGTGLYDAFALLGAALDTAIVADNLLDEAWCGELAITDAPVSAIVEALLKSALVPEGSVAVESTNSYILVRSVENRNRGDACVNREGLSGDQHQMLRRVVNVRLPRADAGTAFGIAMRPLSACLPLLSEQLGVPVTADADAGRLPVNAAVMHGVTRETALNLIVWQWPVPNFGYRVTGEGIHFIRR